MRYESLLHAIGHTPLVRVPFDVPPRIYAKLEYISPGGSIKDRSAYFMVQQAEKEGVLQPGGTIIEASSGNQGGNQGIAAAMIGAAKGYKVIITTTEKVSKEKWDTLTAYGAEVVICKPTLDLHDPEGYYEVARRIHEQTPNSLFMAQYFNQNNPLGHYYSLGPEIWDQTGGQLTHFIGAVGSCGTVGGAGRYIKERNPNVAVVGVDSATSYRSTGGNPKPYKLEGIGVDSDSPLLEQAPIDEIIGVHDDDVFPIMKRLAREYGFLVGPSSGAVAYAAYEYAKNLSPDDFVVIVFGDSGRAYLTKGFYN